MLHEAYEQNPVCLSKISKMKHLLAKANWQRSVDKKKMENIIKNFADQVKAKNLIKSYEHQVSEYSYYFCFNYPQIELLKKYK